MFSLWEIKYGKNLNWVNLSPLPPLAASPISSPCQSCWCLKNPSLPSVAVLAPTFSILGSFLPNPLGAQLIKLCSTRLWHKIDEIPHWATRLAPAREKIRERWVYRPAYLDPRYTSIDVRWTPRSQLNPPRIPLNRWKWRRISVLAISLPALVIIMRRAQNPPPGSKLWTSTAPNGDTMHKFQTFANFSHLNGNSIQPTNCQIIFAVSLQIKDKNVWQFYCWLIWTMVPSIDISPQ